MDKCNVCDNAEKILPLPLVIEKKSMQNKELCDEKTVHWIRFNSSCYSFSTVFESLNFYEALEFCKKQGEKLLHSGPNVVGLPIQHHWFVSSVIFNLLLLYVVKPFRME